MYTKEQEEMALREYERLGSVAAVIQKLGYPSESTLYRWYERKNAGLENRHGPIAEATATMDHHCNTPGHPRHPSAEFKYEVLRRCFESGEDVQYVSREIGYSRMSIYGWRRKYVKYGMVGLMAKRKSIPRAPMLQDHALPESEELEKLRTQLQELQFEVDVMKETIAVLKKDPVFYLSSEAVLKISSMSNSDLQNFFSSGTWLSLISRMLMVKNGFSSILLGLSRSV